MSRLAIKKNLFKICFIITLGLVIIPKFAFTEPQANYVGVIKGSEVGFNYTYGVSVGKDGLLYIADYNNSRIIVCNSDGTLNKYITNPSIVNPQKIALDKDDNIYVLCGYSIVSLDKNGNFLRSFGSNYFGSLTISDDKIYATYNVGSYYMNGNIAIFDLSGNYLGDLNNYVFDWFYDVAIADGKAYAALGAYKYSVGVYDLNNQGAFLYSFSNLTDTIREIAKDSQGYLYILPNSRNEIDLYSKDGIFISTIVTAAQLNYSYISDIYISPDDYLYICDASSNRIFKFSLHTAIIQAEISSPVDKSSINDSYLQITGTASGPDFTGYKLEYARYGVWQEIGTSSTAVENGTLGTLNLPINEEGVYELKLTATDKYGAAHVKTSIFSRGRTWLASLYTGTESQFSTLCGICTGKDGKIYLADVGNNRITVLNQDGSFCKAIGQGEISIPYGIAVDDNDNVYIGSGYSSVRVYDKDGSFLRSITNPKITNVQGVMIKNSKLYIAEYSNHEILVFDLLGNYLDEFGKDYLSGAYDVAIDDEGKAYVGNGYGSYNVAVFDLNNNNNYLFSFGNFNVATDIEIGKEGLLYITSYNYGTVSVYHKEGFLIATVVGNGGEAGQISYPYKIHIDTDGYLYTTEYYNNRIQKFKVSYTYPDAAITTPVKNELLTSNIVPITGTATGTDFASYKLEYARYGTWQEIGTYTSPVTNGVLGTLTLPETEEGIYQVRLTVTDKYSISNSREVTFSKGYPEYHGMIKNPNYLGYTNAVVAGSNGWVWVLDSGNNRICITDEDSNFIKFIGVGELSGPSSMIHDFAGNVYIVDTNHNEVVEYDATGNLVKRFGSGHLSNPTYIALAEDGKIYVTNSGTNKASVFTQDGTYLWEFSIPSYSRGIAVIKDQAYVSSDDGGSNSYIAIYDLTKQGEYIRIFAINSHSYYMVLSPDGFLYTTTSYNMVHIYHPEGQLLYSFGGGGSAPGQFSNISGISFHNGLMYMADYYNKRIQKIKIRAISAPQIELTAPVKNTHLTSNIVPITGTAAGIDFASYKLEYARYGTWQEIGTYTMPITDGLLGTLTLPETEEGIYQVRLTVTDKYSISSSREVTFSKGRIQLLNKENIPLKSFDMVEDNDGNLWVSENTNSRIAIYDTNLKFIKYVGEGNLSGSILGMAKDAVGNIYVCDYGNKAIAVFDPAGNYTSSFGSGQLTSPYGIELDSQGNIYVTNSLDLNVMVFDQDRNYVYTFAQGKVQTGIAIVGNIAYTVNWGPTVSMFDISKNGQYLGSFTSDDPNYGFIGIEKGPDGLLYINNMYHIKVYTVDGVLLYKIGINSANTVPGTFSYLYRTCVLSDCFYAIDYSGGNIQKYKLSVTSPIAAITSPSDYGLVSDIVNISGTAAGVDFASYKLEYAQYGVWQEIGTYTSPVTDGVLGTLTLPEAEEGIYQLRLSVKDTYGVEVKRLITFCKGRLQIQGKYNVPVNSLDMVEDNDGNLWVSENTYGRIAIYDTNFKFIKYVGEGNLSANILGMAKDAVGNIYVCDYGHKAIAVFDPVGNYSSSFGAGKLTNPWGITLDSNGNIYVVNSSEQNVMVFDKDRNYVYTFAQDKVVYDIAVIGDKAYTVNGSINVYMFDLSKKGAFLGSFSNNDNSHGFIGIEKSSDGLLYINGSYYVKVYNEDGGLLYQIGLNSPNTLLGTFQYTYRTYILSDCFYVVDYSGGNIQKFKLSVTSPIAVITSPGDYGVVSDIVNITGTAAGIDFASYKLEYARYGTWQEIGTYTTLVTDGLLGTLTLPQTEEGIYQLRLTVKDTYGVEAKELITFSKGKLQYLEEFDSYTGSQYGQLNTLYGICLGNNSHLYVVEGANNRVVEMDQTGNFVRYIGQSELNHPVGITKDALGNIYVGNYNSSEVCVYNQDGIFLRRFGTATLINPEGLLIKNDKVYVTSHSNSQVAIFDLNGNHLGEFGNGYATYPYDIAISNDNKAYVACYNNVAVFDLNQDNKYLFSFGPFNYATSIKIDNNGYVYVSNYYNYSVDVYTPEGILVCSLGTRGSEPGQFGGTGYGVYGMCFDNDILFTTEYSTHRIQKFKSLYEVTPKILSVSLSKQSPLSTGILTASIVFDRPMNTAVNPTVYYQVMGKTTKYPLSQKSYINTVWTGEVNIETNSDNGDAFIAVSGARDGVNNIPMFPDSKNQFKVDTIAPLKPVITSPTAASVISSGEFVITAEGDTDLTYVSFEKSIDGVNWQEISRVDGTGTKDYVCSWYPLPNEIYLRLRAVDTANNNTYSDVLTGYTLDFSATGNIMLTAPVKNSKVGKNYAAKAYCTDANIKSVRFEKSSDSTDGWDGTWIPLEGTAENSSDFVLENEYYSVNWSPQDETFKFVRLVITKNDETTIVTQGISGFIYDLSPPVAPVSAKNGLVNNNLVLKDNFVFKKNNVLLIQAAAGKDYASASDKTLVKIQAEYSLAGENNWILIGADADSRDADYSIPWDIDNIAEGTLIDIRLAAIDEVNNASYLIYHSCNLDFTASSGIIDFSATSKKGGYIDLAWLAATDPDIAGYNIYRSTYSFTQPDPALFVSTNSGLLSCSDLPPVDGTYYYSITSKDIAGNESQTINTLSAVSDRKPPDYFSFTLTAEPQANIRIAWSVVTDAVIYKVYRDNYIIPTGYIEVAQTAGTEIIDVPLKDGYYRYTVTALDALGNESGIACVPTIVADRGKSDPPGNLTTNTLAANKIQLSWNKPTQEDVASYKIYRSTETIYSIASSTPVLVNISLTSVIDNPGVKGSYYYVATAIDYAGNESDISNCVMGIADDGSIEPPQNLHASTQIAGKIVLTWDAPAGDAPASYKVYRSTVENIDTAALTPIATDVVFLGYVDQLSTNTKYYYAVTAIDIIGNESVISNIDWAIPDNAGPSTSIVLSGTPPYKDGDIQVTLTLNELPQAIPILKWVDSANLTKEITLSGSELNWTGTVSISTSTANGTAHFEFEAIDALGNISHSITSGSTFLIDTMGPVAQITLSPASPVRAGPVNITLALNEAVLNLPQLDLILADSTTINLPLVKDGTIWKTDLDISTNTVNGPAYFQYSAVDILGNNGSLISTNKEITIDTKASNPPQQLQGISQGQGEIQIYWQAPGDEPVKGYNIYRSTQAISGLDPELVIESDLNALVFTDSPAVDGEYYYAVSAIDLAGNESAVSTIGPVLSDRVAPGAPQNLLVMINADHEVELSWNIGTGKIPSAYNIYRSTAVISGVNPAYLIKENNIQTAYTDKVYADSMYYYVVTAKDSIGNESDISTSQSILWDFTPPSAAITISPTSPVKAGLLQVQLNASENLVSVPKLICTPLGDNPQEIILNGNGKSWHGQVTITSSTKNGPAVFTFEGTDIKDNVGTIITAGSCFVIDTVPPAALTGLTANPGMNGQVELSWGNPEGEAANVFNIYRSTFTPAGKNDMTRITSITGISFMDQPTTEQTYYYYVCSEDQAGNESLVSNLVSTMTDNTPPEPVQNLILTATTEAIKLSWDLVTSEPEVTYNIYRSNNQITNINNVSVLAKNITVNEYQDIPNFDGQVYYAVTSVDISNNENSQFTSADIFRDTHGPIATIQLATPSPVKAGALPLKLYISEPIEGTPSLKCQWGLNEPVEVVLSTSTDHWEGNIDIPNNYNGPANFIFQAMDKTNNSGNEIATGQSFIIDNILPGSCAYFKADPQPEGKVKLSWLPPSGEQDAVYQIYRSTADVVTLVGLSPIGSDVSGLNWTDSSVPDGNYFYFIIAKDKAGNLGTDFRKASVTSDSSIPSAPQNLKAVIGADKKVYLSWDLPASGEIPVAYNIYRSDIPGFLIANTAPAWVGVVGLATVDTLAKSGKYYYKVTGIDLAQNESEASNEVNSEVDIECPTAKLNIGKSSIGVGETQVTLTVSELLMAKPTLKLVFANGDEQDIELNGNGLNWTGQISIATGTCNGTADFEFRGEDLAQNIGNILVTNKDLNYIDEVVIDTVAPFIDDFAAISSANGYVQFSWYATEQIKNYYLYREIAPAQTIDGLVPVAKFSSKTIADLPPADGEYYYALIAEDNCNNLSKATTWVKGVSDRTAPVAPLLTLTDQQGKSVKLDWNAVDGAVCYEVYRSAALITAVSSNEKLGTYYCLSALDVPNASNTYYYAVIAKDKAGNASPLSNCQQIDFVQYLPVANIAIDPPSPVNTGINITLSCDKQLAQAPKLVCHFPAGSYGSVTNSTMRDFYVNPVITLHQENNKWVGSLEISKEVLDGVATFEYEGADTDGLVSHVIATGGTFIIDRGGPSCQMTISPFSPVHTGKVTVNLTASENLVETPLLTFTTMGGLPIPVALAGAGRNWQGVVDITSDMKSGYAYFSFAGKDLLNNYGTEIVTGDKFMIDNLPAAAPSNILVNSAISGAIVVSWTPPQDYNLQGYNIYRAQYPMTVKMTENLYRQKLTVLSFTDLPISDGLYYYAVTSIDADGQESELSASVAGSSDRVAPGSPREVSLWQVNEGIKIDWQSPLGEMPEKYQIFRNGAFLTETNDNEYIDTTVLNGLYTYQLVSLDKVGNASIMTASKSLQFLSTFPQAEIIISRNSPVGAGLLDITLITSEEMAEVPVLALTPEKTAAQNISLTGSGCNWHGQVDIPVAIEEGVATFAFSGKGKSGLTGNEISKGQTFIIDTVGPVANIKLDLTQPNTAAGAGKTKVTLTTSEDLKDIPYLDFIPSGNNKIMIPLTGAGNQWVGYVNVSTLTGDGLAIFNYRGTDQAGNIEEKINTGKVFKIDTVPPEAPINFVAQATDYSGGLHGIEFGWEAPTAQSGDYYQVYRTREKVDNVNGLSPLPYPTWDVPPTDAEYYYAIVAVDKAGNKSTVTCLESPLHTVRTVPLPPVNLSVSTLPTGVLHLTWEKPEGETPFYYNVQISAKGDISGNMQSFNSGIIWTEIYGCPQENGLYSFTVTAVDKYGNESAYSNKVVFDYKYINYPVKAKLSLAGNIAYGVDGTYILKTGTYNVKLDVNEPLDPNNPPQLTVNPLDKAPLPVVLKNNGQSWYGEFNVDTNFGDGVATFKWVGVDVDGLTSTIIEPNGNFTDYFVVDTIAPATPLPLAAVADNENTSGAIKITWKPPTGEIIHYYEVYRSEQSFTAAEQAVMIYKIDAPAILPIYEYVDIPPKDGTYYYALVGIDRATNQSGLSSCVSAQSIHNIPVATISLHDQYSGIMNTSIVGEGEVIVDLETSKPLSTAPLLKYTPLSKEPIEVLLTGSGCQWQGKMTITKDTGDGLAEFSYLGTDENNNTSDKIAYGHTFTINTTRAVATIIIPDIYKQVPNLEENKLVTKALKAGDYRILLKTSRPLSDIPELSYELNDHLVIPVKMSGFGDTWEGKITIQENSANGEGSFYFHGIDRQWVESTEIEGVRYEYDHSSEYSDGYMEHYLGERITATYASTGGKFVVDTVPPQSPQNIGSKVLKLGVVEVYWEEQETGCSYKVYRALTPVLNTTGMTALNPRQNQIGAQSNDGAECAKFIVDVPGVDGKYFYAAKAYDTAGNESSLSANTDIFVDSIKTEIKFKAVPNPDYIILENFTSNKTYFTPPKTIKLVLDFPGASPDAAGVKPPPVTVNVDALEVYNPTTQKNEIKYVTYLPQQLSYYNGEVNITVFSPDLTIGEVVETKTGLAVADIPVATGGQVTSVDKKVELIIPAGVKPIIPQGPGAPTTIDAPRYLYYITNEYEEVLPAAVSEGTITPETIDMSKYHPGIMMVGQSYNINLNTGTGPPPEIWNTAGGGYDPGFDLSKVTLNGTPILEMGIDMAALENLLNRSYGGGGETLDPNEKYTIVTSKMKVYGFVEEEKDANGTVTQPGRWEVLKDSFYDPDKQAMVAVPTRVGKFAVFAEQNPPKIIKLQPEQNTATKDFTPDISATVEDMGTGIDPDTIVMKLDGQVVKHIYSSSEYFRGQLNYTPTEMLAPGKHTVSVYAEDVVENKTEFKWEFTVDNEAPKVTTLTPADNTITNVSKPVISCLLSDVGGGIDPQTVELYLDNNKVTSHYDELSGRMVCIPNILGDGLHNVKLKGKDVVGEQIIVEWKFSVDTKGPVAEQYYPLPDSFYNGAKAAFVRITDSISGTTGTGLQAKLDGNPIDCAFDNSGTVTLSNAVTWQEGNHEFIVLCQDNAGNMSALKWSFKVDLTPPSISNLVNEEGISIAVDKPIMLFSLTDSFSGIDPKTIAVKYNDQPITCSFEVASGQLLYQPTAALTDGILKFTITVQDLAGNTASFDKNTAVDTTPPVISDITPANGVFLNNPNPDISALIQDAGVGIDLTSVSLKIDGKANAFAYDKSVEKVNAVSSNIKKVKGQMASSWSEGWHTAEIQVKDLNGNQAAVSWSFLIDTVAPAISNVKIQDNFVNGDYVSARPELKFGLFDQTSGIDVNQVKVILNSEAKTCLVQEIAAPDWQGSYRPDNNLPNGTYIATVEAYDLANNKTVSQEIVFLVSDEINAEKVINYPNPFKEDTKFTYVLPSDADEVRIEVYDLNGELVYETGDGARAAGYNETFWDGKNRYGEDIANGVYIYRLIIRGNGQEKVIKKKMARLR